VAVEVGSVVTPTELLQALHERGYAWVKNTRGLAGLMAPLGLVAKRGREGTRVVRRYLLDPGTLGDLASRYNPAALAVEDPEETRVAPQSVNNCQQA
jgi:hypothetical protein